MVPWTNSPTRIISQVCLREMIIASMSSASKHAHTDMNARGPMDQFSNQNTVANISFACQEAHTDIHTNGPMDQFSNKNPHWSIGPCACISVCARLHTKDMFAMVFWLENWSTGQCACISVCACLHAANIFAMVLWLENWSTGPRACMSPACKHSHTDMHARGPMDEFSNKNHFASMQASINGYACTWSHGPILQQESSRKYVLRDKNHIANMSFMLACMRRPC